MKIGKCFTEKKKLAPLPLIPVFVEEPLRQWGPNFIGEINPPSSGQYKWILTGTYYSTKCVEVVPTMRATDLVVIKFLEDNIFTRFGCPKKLVADNAEVFRATKLIDFCQKHNVILSHSITYHPQGNGLAESSTTLVRILKKTVAENKKN